MYTNGSHRFNIKFNNEKVSIQSKVATFIHKTEKILCLMETVRQTMKTHLKYIIVPERKVVQMSSTAAKQKHIHI